MGGKNPLGGMDSLTDQDGCSLDIESSGLESRHPGPRSDPSYQDLKAAWNPTSLGSELQHMKSHSKSVSPEMVVMSPLLCGQKNNDTITESITRLQILGS